MILQKRCVLTRVRLVNVLAFYSSTIFAQLISTANDNTTLVANDTALYLTLAFGFINFLFALPAIAIIDRFGRRVLMISTLPFMFLFLLIAGLCFRINSAEHKAAYLGSTTAFILLFAICYSPGAGPIPFTYSAEVFPISHRELGMSWAVAVSPFDVAVLTTH